MQTRLLIPGAVVLVLLCVVATVMIALSLGGDDEDENSVWDMMLQPNDLPSSFVLQEERFYTREELFQELSATAQVAEDRLQYALHRRFVTDEDFPQQVDVLVYIYDDTQGAIAGHEYLRGDQGIVTIQKRLIGGQEPHDYEAQFGGDPDLGEDSVVFYVTLNARTASPVQAQVFGMRHANVRAEVTASVHAGFHALPEDAAQSQLLRIQQAPSPPAIG